ncbi:MAG: hypothetical protein JJT75_00785 [Opitutales bacterium]|nr:hypothetical protein [Opitutales bacterium]MCH8541397.1 hypothetical protein [Opitutales bacterium]
MKSKHSTNGTSPEAGGELSRSGQVSAILAPRFTLDGDAALEKELATICDWVCDGLGQRLPAGKLEAVVLGGGYGRGEGGVLREKDGDRPYNDMEFYVYLRGNSHLNEFRYRAKLGALEHEVSAKAGIEVEFKLQSLKQTQKDRVSMFSYDLAMGHRIVLGSKTLFEHCGHHRNARKIPSPELTRLLMNRCSGLLFAKQRLEDTDFSPDDADFVARNLAKLRLAIGDVVLGFYGQYHWSCRERSRRLKKIRRNTCGPWLDAVRHEHQKGMEFKLHPSRSTVSQKELHQDFHALSELAGNVWLWLEELRLERKFNSFADYALAEDNKCHQRNPLRNFLINLQQFGVAGVLSDSRFRYPRERMLRALPVLLWERVEAPGEPMQLLLQEQLYIGLGKAECFIDAYECLWRRFR